MRFAIVDDLEIDIQILWNFIEQFAEENGISLVPPPISFKSGEAFLSEFTANRFDVIFLDILMKGIDGMEVARQIRELDTKCCIIFTTTSAEFAVESYEVDASWYLVKPYNYKKLSQALEHCSISLLEQELHIVVGKKLIYLHQIAYTEYIDRYIYVHYQNGENFSVRISQSEFSELLSDYPYFCDCVRGILVNFEAVNKLLESSFLLKDGTNIPISRLKYKEVQEKFFEFCYIRLRGGKT